MDKRSKVKASKDLHTQHNVYNTTLSLDSPGIGFIL